MPFLTMSRNAASDTPVMYTSSFWLIQPPSASTETTSMRAGLRRLMCAMASSASMSSESIFSVLSFDFCVVLLW